MSAAFRFGSFELRPASRQLLMEGQPVVAGARALDVLQALIERRDRVVTKQELLDLAWPGLVVEENNLQVQISTLRKVLGRDAITTVAGRGYRFTWPVEPVDPLRRVLNARPITTTDDESPSTAVLPFVNIGDDAQNEYFADGLAEELLNMLSRIRGLRVASRTSAFSFKGTNADLPTIGQKLNVTTVLQGSVRSAGKRARISAQLVDVATDSQLWSESYDRELDDIFAVQDDIAQAVVEALRTTLLGTMRNAQSSAAVRKEIEVAARGRGDNAEAYRLYLLARFFEDRLTREDVGGAIEHYRHALKIEPDNAMVWAALSRAYSSQAGHSWIGFEEGYRAARHAAEQALRYEPDLAEGHTALGFVCMHHDWNWIEAELGFRRALHLAPGNAQVLSGAGYLSSIVGRMDEACGFLGRAVALDPLSVTALRSLAQTSLVAERLAEAEAAVTKAIELDANGGRVQYLLGCVRLRQGRLDESLEAFERETIRTFRLLGVALVQHARARPLESGASVQELIEWDSDGSAYQIAQAYAYHGEVDLAFDWLQRAYTQRDPGVTSMKRDPLLRDLHDDVRWRALLSKMRLAD